MRCARPQRSIISPWHEPDGPPGGRISAEWRAQATAVSDHDASNARAVPPGFLWRHPAHFYALGFGTGLVPVAPGTFGTLVAFPIAFTLWRHGTATVFLVAIVALGLLGAWAADITGRALGVPDHGSIVCDEIVAMLLVLFVTGPSATGMIAGFVLFRLFDILKPPPIRQLDRRFKNGWGVMADDLLAAAYALLVLAIWQWIVR